MEIKLKQHWLNIRNSLWFIPTLMAVAALILAFGLIALDRHITYDDLHITWFLYSGQREGARSLLSTIASSMVTIAGVTFSITLVALTMASGQFGPRLLRNFIADKGNQLVIGTFIATFIYSLIVLLTIHGTGENEFVPKISVVFGFLLAIFSLGVIIFFIHHVTTSIQADYVIKSSYDEFRDVAGNTLLDANGPEQHEASDEEIARACDGYIYKTATCFTVSGFIQSIDFEGICQCAQENDLLVKLQVRPGSFVAVHEPMAEVFFREPLTDAVADHLRQLVVIGYQRTPNQDLLFSPKQIVEVGVRSLSPGINDPHTASTCIEWLGAALSVIAKKKFEGPVVKDGKGTIRVLKNRITYRQVLETCFNHLRLYAITNIYITADILKALKKAMEVTNDPDFLDELQNTAALVLQDVRQRYHQEAEVQLIDRLYRDIMQVYEKKKLV